MEKKKVKKGKALPFLPFWNFKSYYDNTKSINCFKKDSNNCNDFIIFFTFFLFREKWWREVESFVSLYGNDLIKETSKLKNNSCKSKLIIISHITFIEFESRIRIPVSSSK